MKPLAILALLALTACATTGPCPPQADKVTVQREIVPAVVAAAKGGAL